MNMQAVWFDANHCWWKYGMMMRASWWSRVAGTVALVLTACQETPDAHRRVVIDTLGSGIISVQNPAEGIWDQDEVWSVTEVLRIGSVSGGGADMFGSVGAVTLDERGWIWAYDQHAKELRVFDENGSHVRTVGRAGAGPGEFNEVVGLLWSTDGDLWTVDQRAGRVSVFDSAGVFLTSQRIEGTSFHAMWPGIIDRNGYFHDVAGDFATGETFLVRRDSSFRVVDSLAVPAHPKGAGTECRSRGIGTACVSIPYAPAVKWVLTDDGGLWAALTDQYVLLRLSPSGDTLRLVTRQFDPVPLHGAERDTLQLPMLFGEPIDRSLLPATKPVIARLIVDDERNLWVVRLDTRTDTTTVDVFDHDGIYQGELRLPVRIHGRPVAIRDGHLATVVSDSLGVDYVARFGIRKR